jgi:glycine/D-amino acid oxidase-like deaminating enzyme
MDIKMCDVVVIGGGFFGCSIAAHIARKGKSVLVLEKAEEMLAKASYNNQARVHNGYHYPRSILTARRSRINYPIFKRDYSDCIYEQFIHYYAVPRNISKVTAGQFQRFMERVGSPIKMAPKNIRGLFSNLIEEVFEVEECAFDSKILLKIVQKELVESGVHALLRTEVLQIMRQGERMKLVCSSAGAELSLSAKIILNCTYSNINTILRRASSPPIKLKHEITEMALVNVPNDLKSCAFTVMCGSFFSLMPFPSRGLHTLSHVRYTPHCSWQEGGSLPVREPCQELNAYSKRSKFEHMRRDAMRYLPKMSGVEQQDSLWEVKTVLPQSEADDSRPILFQQAANEPALWCVMGGKIDNIYDAIAEWDNLEIKI